MPGAALVLGEVLNLWIVAGTVLVLLGVGLLDSGHRPAVVNAVEELKKD